MKTSQAGLDLITSFEGEILHVYIDVANKPTIGVGHLLKPGESFANGITYEQAMSLLANDVIEAENAVNSHVTVLLTQNEFDACVDFTYNVGSGAFASSSLLKQLNAGNVQSAADGFLLWDKAVVDGKLVQVPGLLRRRIAERAMFLSSTFTNVATDDQVQNNTDNAKGTTNA